MKKAFLLCLTLVWVLTPGTNAQINDTTSNVDSHKIDATALLQKSKSQKTTAWVVITGGFVLTTIGLSIIAEDAANDAAGALVTIFSLGFATPENKKNRAGGPILAIAGTGAMLLSIPVFTRATRDKRKAALMLKDETVFFNRESNIKEHMPAIRLKINL